MLRLMLLSLLSLGRTTAIGSPPAKLYVAVWTMPWSVIAGTLKISQPTTKASIGSTTSTPSTPSVQLRTRWRRFGDRGGRPTCGGGPTGGGPGCRTVGGEPGAADRGYCPTVIALLLAVVRGCGGGRWGADAFSVIQQRFDACAERAHRRCP